MTHDITRRAALGTVAAGATTLALFRTSAFAQDKFANGDLTVYPVQHASLYMDWDGKTIVVDPVGGADAFAAAGAPDLILVTHEHPDHFDPATLSGIITRDTTLVTSQSVFDKLPDDLKSQAKSMSNGDTLDIAGFNLSAIPAYNTTEDRKQYHPEGRDNGYVLDDGTTRVYIAGDTEDIPEMRALKNIDVAFVPMNLPYTMTEEQAADAVAEFAPKVVYPYHYRGSDTQKFADLVKKANDSVEVRLHDWYS